jgi:hypothetical protein
METRYSTSPHCPLDTTALNRAQLLAKLTYQQAALAAIIKVVSYNENAIETDDIINLQIHISSTLDLLLNPI